MKNGIEIRPNGVKINKIQGNSIPQYVVEGSKNGPWDYIANARKAADEMSVSVCYYLTDMTFDQRKPFIETAVFLFNGKYPDITNASSSTGSISYFYLNLNSELYLCDMHHRPDVWRGRVCTQDEFNKVADAIENKLNGK